MNPVRVVASILFIVVLAGCASGGPSASPASPASPGATSAAASTAATGAPSSGATVTQTETDWGRIWDALPAGFPVIPGATPDEEAAGPASAVFA